MSSIRLPKQVAVNIAFEPEGDTTSNDVQNAIIETRDDINKHLHNLMSTYLVSATSMTINANPALFDIAPFFAVFVDNYTDPENPVYTELSYAGSTGNSVTNISSQDGTIISIDKNGNILQTVTFISAEQQRDYVSLGGLIHTNRSTISTINQWTSTVGIDVPASLVDFSNSIGPVNVFGNVLSGNLTNTLQINKSAGETFKIGGNWDNNRKSPNIKTDAATTASYFYHGWRNGTGGFTTILANTLTPGRYDDNTVGGITTPNGIVSPNKWQLYKVWRIIQSNFLAIEYGQTTYSSFDAAFADKERSTSVNPTAAQLQFRGWYVVKGSCTNLNNPLEALFIDAGKFSTSTGGATVGSSTTTLQGTYNNSVTPEILTDVTRGALSIRNGQAADTATVFEGQNIAGTNTFSVTGSGQISATKLTVTSTTNGIVFPNMTTTQKNATTAVAGCVVYDTTLNKLCVYNGSAWQTITSV